MSQIFFNCLVTELFVAATFNETSTTTPPICVQNMSHPRWAHLLANDTNGTNATDATDDGIEGRMLGVKVAGEAGPDMTGMVCSGGGDLMLLTNPNPNRNPNRNRNPNPNPNPNPNQVTSWSSP